MQSVAYDEQCARLKIDCLELQRLYADLILCYTSSSAVADKPVRRAASRLTAKF